MTCTILIKSGVEFQPTGRDYQISSACATLGWFPRDWHSNHQSVHNVRFHVFPKEWQSQSLPPRLIGDEVELHWDMDVNVNVNGCNDYGNDYVNGYNNVAEFCVEATIETRSDIVPVTDKIPFPIPQHYYDMDMDMGMDMLQYYLQADRIANQSPQIQQLASRIVAGENDLYRAVFAIATYIHDNIQYTIDHNSHNHNHNNIKSASRVLTTKTGKCDEITALFISMLRSLHIPTRFVSGYAYTNDHNLFDHPWGGHTWAEVYFPTIGFVPFDVTYGQYGYVDAGHVVLSAHVDGERRGDVQYTTLGMDVRPVGYGLDTVVDPIRISGNKRQDLVSVALEAQENEVGFGSAAVVVAIVRNNENHYVSTRLDLVSAEDITFLSENNHDAHGYNNNGSSRRMNVLLGPREVLEIPFFFIMDNEDGYLEGYRYEYPFEMISDCSSRSARVNIIVRDGAPMFYARR